MKECCQDVSNRILQPVDPNRPDIHIEVCTQCGCRHIEMEVDPGRFGIVGASI
jgi:hypothetical protein